MYQHVLRCSTEIETTFGTDQVESWRDQRIVEGTYAPKLIQNRLPDLTTVARLHDRNPPRPGSKAGSGFSAGFYLDGLPSGLTSAVSYTAPQNSILEILTNLMGGVRGGSGSTVQGGGATTTIIPVVETSGFAVGGACIIGGQCRRVTAISATPGPGNLTLSQALSGAPAADTVVYGTVTVFLDEDNVGGDGDSLAFRFLGYHADDQMIFRGCNGTFTLSGAINELCQINAEYQAATWSPTSGETLSGATYSGAGPLPIMAGEIVGTQVGSTAMVNFPIPEWSFDPGLSLVAAPGLTGVQTTLRHRMLRSTPKLSLFAPFYWDTYPDALLDEFDASDSQPTQEWRFMLQYGNSPMVSGAGTGVVAIEFGQCYYTGLERVNAGPGFDGYRFNFEPREDTAGTTDISRSVVRIHLG